MLQFDPADPSEQRSGWTRDDLFRALDQRFTFTDEITRSFAADVFWRCVLPKIQPPTGLIKGRWMAPGGMYYGNPKTYYGCYIWDTAFMVVWITSPSVLSPCLRRIPVLQIPRRSSASPD